MFVDIKKHKIVPSDEICIKNHLTKDKEYKVLETDNDDPMTPDEYYKIKNDLGLEIWVDDWDCKRIL